MDYKEALDYIDNIQKELASDYSLDAVKLLCEQMGRPDRKLKIIHIAGTNGKGSVGAFISNVLAMCGYTVGRYVSPTLFDYRERIQKLSADSFGVETEWIQEEQVAHWMELLSKKIDEKNQMGKRKPTAFEIETVMAFCQMAAWHVNVAVIETGMGGALDATNIIEKPVLTVFTPIAMDHMAILGDTLEKIADQKFGILKPEVPVITGIQEPSVMEKLRTICDRRGLKLRIAHTEEILQQEFTMERTSFRYQGKEYLLSQRGVYQPQNAIIAIEAMKLLQENGFYKINSSSIKAGIATTTWEGRFEVLSHSPFLIMDGAHNPAGAIMLKKSLRAYFPSEKYNFIFGVFADKDYDKIIEIMLPLAKRVYTVQAHGPRAMDSQKLAECVQKIAGDKKIEIESAQTFVNAMGKIYQKHAHEKIVVFGSLSFLSEVKEYFDSAAYL